MSDRRPEVDNSSNRRRRYSSESEDDRKRKDRPERRRSFDRSQPGDRNGRRMRDDSRSDYRSRRRSSRSPRSDPVRERREHQPRSRSPSRPPRSSRNDRNLPNRNRSASRSPPPKRRRNDSRHDRRPSRHHPARRRSSPTPPPPHWKRSTAPLPSQQAAFKHEPPSADSEAAAPEKQKPNYAPTGKLAAETNTAAHAAIVLKYHEPPEARAAPPSAPWRLYVFKGPDLLDTLALRERSCWLFGRERAVVDVPTEHPSCSKQHAVLQFRSTMEGKGEEGRGARRGGGGGVGLYVIDLESANGTRVNGEVVPERRFVEVRSGDVLTFGESSREYVLMLPPKDPPKG